MRSIKPALGLKEKTTTEDPELAARFNQILEETVEALEGSGARYAFIGGIASGGLGRPRSTHDIDIFVTPEDAEVVLRALGRKGFKTEKTDPAWLYKGFKEGILVDVIFKSKGDIYFDTEMYQRMTIAEFHGKRLRLVAPEDLLIIKAVAHSEQTPGHWHDAIALLSHARLDWDYLVRRARRAPRRILSLLLYAQSNDIGVPNYVIHNLYEEIFGNVSRPQPAQKERYMPGHATHPSIAHPAKEERLGALTPEPAKVRHDYGLGHIRERLAEDPRLNELDIRIEQEGDKVLLRGEVSMPDRRLIAEQVVRETLPDCTVENQIRILETREPAETEKFS